MTPTPSPIPEEMLDQARRTLAPLVEAVEQFKRSLTAQAPAMAPAFAAFAQAVRSIHDAMYAKYLEAGRRKSRR